MIHYTKLIGVLWVLISIQTSVLAEFRIKSHPSWGWQHKLYGTQKGVQKITPQGKFAFYHHIHPNCHENTLTQTILSQEYAPQDTLVQWQLHNQCIMFGEHQIRLNGISGKLATVSEMNTYFEVLLWLPQHTTQEDTFPEPQEIVGKMVIGIQKGTLFQEGQEYILSPQNINVTQNGVVLQEVCLLFNIPHNLNPKDLVLIVNIREEMNTEKIILNGFKKTEEAKDAFELVLDIYPISCVEKSTLYFKTCSKEPFQVKLFTQQGFYVTTLYEGKACLQEEITLEIHKKEQHLTQGRYYVYAQAKNEYYLETFYVP